MQLEHQFNLRQGDIQTIGNGLFGFTFALHAQNHGGLRAVLRR